MSAALRLSRVAAIPAAPLLVMQGRRLRRDTPRLPDAATPWNGSTDGPDPLTLLVLGDSTAAGVGAATQDEALPGNLARELAARTGRGVDWTALGRNGATARDIVTDYLDDATAGRWDVALVTIGANDALGLRSRRAFGRDIRAIMDALTLVTGTVLVSSLPSFGQFELLPNPLRFNLYLHSRSLEEGARRIVGRYPRAHMSPPPPKYTAGFFASDRFHPSASGYRDWARFAIDDAADSGALTGLL